MFFISCNTIAVNMNLGDQANLAALLRGLVRGGKKGKESRDSKAKTGCLFQGERGSELLSPAHRPRPKAGCLVSWLAGCCTVLRLVHPQPSMTVWAVCHLSLFLVALTHLYSSGLFLAQLPSMEKAFLPEIISHNASHCDRCWHCCYILPRGWGHRQHFSTGTSYQAR